MLYTYGGFHESALSFINAVAEGSDPAVAMVSLSTWKDDLKDRIAMCTQRHTADIVIDDARRARVASLPGRRRGSSFEGSTSSECGYRVVGTLARGCWPAV